MCPQKKIPLISLIFTETIRANQCQSVGDFYSYQLCIMNYINMYFKINSTINISDNITIIVFFLIITVYYFVTGRTDFPKYFEYEVTLCLVLLNDKP